MVAMDVVGMLTEECRRPILPQPTASEPMRCKRRMHGLAYMVPQQTTASGQPLPTAVAKRNERERRRVKMVNLGFNSLRQHVPNGVKNKKLSKVETLRSAIEYIRQLQDVVTDPDSSYEDRNENYAPTSAANYHHHQQHLQQYSMMQSPQPGGFGHMPFQNSSGCSTASSPTPSLGSTESRSPTAPDQFSSSEEDFLGITTWLA